MGGTISGLLRWPFPLLGLGRLLRLLQQREETLVSGQTDAGRGIHGGRSGKLIGRHAVAPLRPRPYGPPLRGRATLRNGMTTGGPEGLSEHETGRVGFHKKTPPSGRRLGGGALRSLQTLSTRREPDIILLDLNLPGMSGLEAIPFFASALPAARIIVLTQSDASRT